MNSRTPTKPNRPWLEAVATIPVRFHQVDALGIVWHGHYVEWFEEARQAFGRQFGVDYPVFRQHQVAAPVVNLWIEYKQPARLQDVLTVTARLLKPEAAKFEFQYEVRCGERLLAVGGTTQVFTTPGGELLLTPPPFIQELYRQWEPLWTQP
jgi:acyl-CoA thioester hydrolase